MPAGSRIHPSLTRMRDLRERTAYVVRGSGGQETPLTLCAARFGQSRDYQERSFRLPKNRSCWLRGQ